MAEWDWNQIGSLAANILPAVVGAIGGAGRGGIGAIPGALQGAGMAAKENIEGEQERQKYNNLLQIQQQTREQAQQRIDLDKEQLTAQKDRWAQTDKASEVAMRYHEAQIADLNRKTKAASTSAESYAEFVKTLPPDQRNAAMADDPDKFLADYRKRRDDDTARKSMAISLKSFKIPNLNVDEYAKGAPIKEMADLIQDQARIRNTPRAGNVDLKVIGDKVYLVDQHTGTYKVTDIKPGKDKDDLRTAHEIQTEARQQVEAPFKTGPMGAIEMGKLGKTAQEQASNFQGMINKRARELATERGVGSIFKDDPAQGLADGLSSGAINSSSAAVAYLISQGVSEGQAKNMAADIVSKSKGKPTKGGESY